MSFSLQFLGVIVLLLPGFILLLVWMLRADEIRVQRVLPGNNSLIVLTLVPLSALIIHTFWGGVFFLQDYICSHFNACLGVSFEPNPYKLIFGTNEYRTLTDIEYAYLPGIAALIALSPLLIQNFIQNGVRMLFPARFQNLENDSRNPEEDWLSYLLRISQPDDRYLVCYIVSKISNSSYHIGYSGVVEKIRLDSDGDIQSITIDDCCPFRLEIGEDGFRRIPETRNTAIRFLTFNRSEIQNISFEVQIVGEVGDEAAPDEQIEADGEGT